MDRREFSKVNFFTRSWPIADSEFSIDSMEGFYFAKDNWDDFGFRTSYQVVAYFDNKINHLGSINVSYYPYKDELIPFDRLKAGTITLKVISLGNIEYYRFINDIFYEEDRKNFYMLLGDLAYDTSELTSLYQDLNYVRMGAFGLRDLIRDSFFRNNNFNEVKNQFHRMTLGGSYKEEYQVSFKDEDNQELINFNINPDDFFPSSLYTIVGRNGSGKTQLLKEVTEIYLSEKSTAKNLAGDEINLETESEQFRNLIFISYSPFDSDFPPRTGENSEYYKFIGLNYSIDSDLSDEIAANIFRLFREAGKRYRTQLKDILQKFEFDYWFSTLNELVDEQGLPLNSIKRLSSGQKIILLNLLNLITNVSERTLVIIDEPELFLHPPLLKAYIRAIDEIVEEKNGVCLFATHSAIVLQEIPHTNVWYVQRNDEIGNRSILEKINFKTFGENSSFINDTIFGMDLRNTGFYKYIIDAVADSEFNFESIEGILGSEALLIRQIEEAKSAKD
ncbi:AAA family ATPase [Streptococcus cristatus]|uniref:AAA family ATPase n=1 Tax=Streptococcus cristatus TaxID=45634 RepID=UPI0011E6F45F|nr:AAA family ATPase [Streptococcus cristatus]